MFELVQWCFRNETAGITTIFITFCFFAGIKTVILAYINRNKPECSCDYENDD